jgi:peptidoglycan/xylan/chitin deacetylase (PgdA/CDA1 family)
MRYLSAKGYQTVSLVDLAKSDSPLPARPIAITFDDGYACLHGEALPALSEHGFTATVFLVAGSLGGSNVWEQAIGDVAEPMLSLSEIEEMSKLGIEFGSHTMTHPHLSELSRRDVAREVADSRALLEDALGAPCLSFAYPYGDWNREVRESVEEAGYSAACTTRRAVFRAGEDPLAMPRVNIRRYNVLPRFRYKLWRAGRVRP